MAAIPQYDSTLHMDFVPVHEKDSGRPGDNYFQSISRLPCYQRMSFEELRLTDFAKLVALDRQPDHSKTALTERSHVLLGTGKTFTLRRRAFPNP